MQPAEHYTQICLMDNRLADTWGQVRNNFLITKPTKCTNLSSLFLEWNSTCFGQFLCPASGVFHCTHSNDICHTGLLTACKYDQDGTQFHPDPTRKLSANLHDIYHCVQQDQDGTEFHPDPARKLSEKVYDISHCCVYSEKLLMMDRGTVRNM